MERARVLRRERNMRFNHFPDEEPVLSDEAGIDQLAFEIGVALLD
jgi:hypothetical protein